MGGSRLGWVGGAPPPPPLPTPTPSGAKLFKGALTTTSVRCVAVCARCNSGSGGGNAVLWGAELYVLRLSTAASSEPFRGSSLCSPRGRKWCTALISRPREHSNYHTVLRASRSSCVTCSTAVRPHGPGFRVYDTQTASAVRGRCTAPDGRCLQISGPRPAACCVLPGFQAMKTPTDSSKCGRKCSKNDNFQNGDLWRTEVRSPPPRPGHALVQATAGVWAALILGPTGTKCSAAT